MLTDLVQKGVRTAYRALGARPVELRQDGAMLGGFSFEKEVPGESGDSLVLLHGLGDACTTWFRVLGGFRELGRVLAVDLPPFGLSRLERGHAVSPREHARLVAGVLEQECDGASVVVGQSLGGWVATWLAFDHPHLVDRLVLIAPAGAPLPGSMEAMTSLRPGSLEEVRAYMGMLWHEVPPGLELFVREMRERLNGPEIRDFLDGLNPADGLEPEPLARIEVPTWILWGRQDRLLDPRTPAYLAKHWGAPVQRDYFRRAAHMVHQERPDAVVSRVQDALEA